jgi:hypothetical protein
MVYFGGGLFDAGHLAGNLLFASAMEKVSEGRFKCVLPQDCETPSNRSADIRNTDILTLISCDAALFCFDGAELDSGTVAEYMLAKFLDIPSLIVRTDFRSAGDQDNGGDPWNLMCSSYPRTAVLRLNGMALYKEAAGDLGALFSKAAAEAVKKLDDATKMKPVFGPGLPQPREIYKWALRAAGGGLEKKASDESFIDKLIQNKSMKGLL